MKRLIYVSIAVARLAMPVIAQDAEVDLSYVRPQVEAASGGSRTFGDCPGGESGRADLQLQTENVGHLGIHYIPSLDIYWGSARGADGPPNLVYKFDNMGNLIDGEEFLPIDGARTDVWGYRDMASDGTYLYAGWSGGLARHNIDGSGGGLHFDGGAPGGVGVWRALAYDPTGAGGSGSLWTANFGSALIEVNANSGALLNSFPNMDGWSLYGLAYDPFTGNLWGYSSPSEGDIVEIDVQDGSPTQGRETGVHFRPGCIPGTGGPNLQCQIQGGLTAVPGGAFGGSESFWDLVSLGQGTSDSMVATMIYCGSCDPCDMNCDGTVDVLDIDPFLDLLFDSKATRCAACTGDVNRDGQVDAFDLEPFLDCLFP